MELRENILFADRYRWLRLLGRGGSWLIEARLCRVSFRNSYAPGVRGYSLGLRLVC